MSGMSAPRNAVEVISTVYPEPPGRTIKYVFKTSDRATFEAVQLWEGDHGAYSVCMSAQAGCRYGCTHCATTFARTPFVRNLQGHEIVAAVEQVAANVRDGQGPLAWVDFAGVGDAAANWAHVTAAARTITNRELAREVKVTSIAPQAWVRSLLKPQAWLPNRFMFSLHGAYAAQRRMVIPRADDPVEVLPLWAAAADLRPVVLNYVLCEHNTRPKDEVALTDLLTPYAGRFLLLRLSSFNPVQGSPLSPSPRETEFIAEITRELTGWTVAHHSSAGRGTGAACGQLRAGILELGPSADVVSREVG
ncbi:Adenine C2-methylase RlmN of 23S rRNA A2503 and tRNA A37 [Streptomyces misionensis]|uniref:Adenine C2-methylase RlmN of 23S rRNA A2503 and tRNA A37 n=1 Tax=Streptomyces misionensis TaxID=67331 RepID=A0A1H4QNE6_9ACTN|nr:hypothetical protein [Streptomyces misionensis]SEC21047.1 Adenine C2-methylase RlmN of 23S rRNA A2503 and tRNA A37 [Streptomyces misionensis]